MTNLNSHIPDAERIDAYISGGMSADERTELESHLNECPACAAAAAVARTSDDALRRMFADARPTAGFEDRLIRAVRQEPQRRLWIPMPIRKAAIAAAAVLVIGTVGYYGTNQLNGGGGMKVASSIQCASNLRQIGQAILLAPGAAVPQDPLHPQDGQNVLSKNKTPFDSMDSVIVPTDDGDARKQAEAAHGLTAPGLRIEPTATEARASSQTENFKPAEFWREASKDRQMNSPVAGYSISLGNTLAVSGSNAYAAGSTLSTGKPADVDELITGVGAPGQGSNAPVQQPTTPAVAPPPPDQQQPPSDGRKIIRNGTMEFEVESFDTALDRITKIVHEFGGFVSTTDSQKLPNGKVKGTVTLRVPPEKLDGMVLSLRALGDLKSQQINAQDVSKEYNDLESELAAAKAMEDRLLDLIKNGKGSIKDLLAAEQELGVWREKIAQAEGQIRYYNNLIGMSTLSITLYERDIKTPATVEETETADMGVESQDVEKARNDALKAIEDAKGRVLQAELKRFDGGQLAAKIEANVPSESAGAVIDRLKQIGRVARLEIHREQTAPPASDPATAFAPQKIDRLPTRLLISLYNLANVAPRKTTNVTLAAADVESAYAALLGQIKVLEGRVVTSNLDRGDASQNGGSIVFEVPPEKLEAVKALIATEGDVLKLSSMENADTQNTTDSKYGFTVQLVPLASIQPRESVHQAIAAAIVPETYHAILDAMNAAHSRVRMAQLNEQDQANVSAVIDVEVPRAGLDSVNKALAAAGDTVARDVSRASDTDNTVDSKVLIQLTVMQANRLAARQTTTMEIQVSDPTKAVGDAETAVIAAGGAVVDSNISRDRSGQETAKVALDLPLGKVEQMLGVLKSLGAVRSIDSSRDTKAPAGTLAHAHLDISFGTSDAIVASDTGLWATVRDGLATSIEGLLWSVRLVVVGLCLIGPWVLVGWIGWRLWWRRKPRQTAA